MGVEKGGRGAGGGDYILGLPEVNTTTYGLKCHYYYCDIICFFTLTDHQAMLSDRVTSVVVSTFLLFKSD